METLARRVLPEKAGELPSISEFAASVREQYARRWTETTKPYPGIPELLCELQKRNLPVAVLSNKPDDFTQLTVEKFLPNCSFAAVVGLKPGMPEKPDPTSALQIARYLQVPPDRILYLGDTNTDMRTANAAGMFPAGVLWGFRTAEELRQSGAKVLLKYPREVLNLLS